MPKHIKEGLGMASNSKRIIESVLTKGVAHWGLGVRVWGLGSGTLSPKRHANDYLELRVSG